MAIDARPPGRLAALAALALSTLLAACAAPVPATNSAPPTGALCVQGGRLPVGQTCQVRIEAARRETPLPLALAAGDRYRIDVQGGQQWNDWHRRPVDPLAGDNGEDSLPMRLGTTFKRMPGEPYMTLGVALRTDGTCRSMRVGPQGQVLALQDGGKVALFANDIPLLNWNNSGSVWVTVQRLLAE